MPVAPRADLDLAVREEAPVHHVVVVADHGNHPHDELALRAPFVAVPPDHVAPGALEDARDARLVLRPAGAFRHDAVDVGGVRGAIDAGAERIGQATRRELAGVDEGPHVPVLLRGHVRHEDLGQVAFVQHWPLPVAVAPGGGRHDHADSRVRPDVEAPAIPRHDVAVQRVAGPGWLPDLERGCRLAQGAHRGAVEIVPARHDRHRFVVGELENLLRVHVHHHDEALDPARPRIAIAGSQTAGKHTQALAGVLRLAEVAGRHRDARHELRVGDAAFLQGLSKARILHRLLDDVGAELALEPHRLHALALGPRHEFLAGDVHRRLEDGRALRNDDLGRSGERRARLPRPYRRLVWRLDLEARESGRVGQLARLLQDLEHREVLLARQGVERVQRRLRLRRRRNDD